MPNEASDLGNGASADEEALGPSFAAESPVRFSLLSFSSFLSYGFYYKYDMNEIPLYWYSAPLFSQEPEETDIRPPLSLDSADMVLLIKRGDKHWQT